MPVIICIIIVMFLVLLGWTWSSLEDIEKTKKIEYIIVGFVVVYIITIIIYQISKIGISYENREIMKAIQNILVLVFSIVNGYILLPYIFKKIVQIQNDEIDDKKFKKSIVILIAVIIILTIIESNYLANAQNETLQIIDRLKK
ncbi:unknown [Clostridium sp. CAG:575]|nr:unknown [Clostridium sp. CAG:575]